MNNEDFSKIVADRVDKINKVLGAKGKEYSSATDRLHNFKLAATIQCCTPEQALYGMMCKHLVSVHDIVFSGAPVSKEIINEKIGDTINYHILLEALILERINENRKN